MTGTGFEEQQSAYDAGFDPQMLVGQFRRLGDAGPAYEIMSVHDDQVAVEIVYSDEAVSLKLAEVLTDPIAETLP